MSIDSATIKRTNKAAWRSFNNQGVVLDTSNSRIFGLNKTGAKLWELLGDNDTVESLVNRFAESFQKNPSEVKQDVLDFLEVLKEKGLVHLVQNTD